MKHAIGINRGRLIALVLELLLIFGVAHFGRREIQLCNATEARRVSFVLDLGRRSVGSVNTCFLCSYIMP